jgi:hypothetical protein
MLNGVKMGEGFCLTREKRGKGEKGKRGKGEKGKRGKGEEGKRGI